MPETAGLALDPRTVRPFLRRLFEGAGLCAEDAAVVSENLYEAEMRGVYSHGLSLAKDYVRRFASGGVNRAHRVRVIRETPALTLVDGDFAPGAVAGRRAMALCIAKAKQTGLAASAVYHGCHFGMAAFYSMMALGEDMIGVALCNSAVNTAVYGGAEAVMGSNPVSVAVPAGKRRPIVYDGGTSAATFNRILFYHREGSPIPEGWALDMRGEPTVSASEALSGTMLPFGGHKGSGVAVLVNILSAALSGAELFAALGGQEQKTGGVGFYFSALDVRQIRDLAEFKESIDTMIDRFKASPKRPGVDEIYLPGELEFIRRERHERHGLPVKRSVFEELRETAEAAGVRFDLNEQ
ncbi:MAG: Ldh family oxidoreductase [Spirochaetaceae bacterium]|jgi:LDH2 family malate/lactate/ureidoglycolate dehydrogenase|nr:Ldh family oxidoreductase [Spirochaetaceae bacterium]